MNSHHRQRLAQLSPEKRALLEQRLLGARDQVKNKPPSIPRRPNQSDFIPLSSAQERVWFSQELAPDSPLYNEVRSLLLDGELNLDILQQSLDTVIARHESLRTTIVNLDGTPQQQILPYREVKISTSPAHSGDEKSAITQLEIAAQQTFDLSNDALIRVVLTQLSPTKHLLLVVMHHLICDGLSIGIFFNELSSIYNTLILGGEVVQPALLIQYGDFALWQKKQLQETDLHNARAFWKDQLKDAPSLLELPTDHKPPPVLDHRGARFSFTINKSLYQKIRHTCQSLNITPFTLVSSALSLLLSRYSRQNDIVLGIPISNRDKEELLPLIGFLVDTVVLRTKIPKKSSFAEFCKKTSSTLETIFSQRILPFEKILEELELERQSAHSPLFQVLLNWRDSQAMADQVEFTGLKSTDLQIHNGTSKFELSFFFADLGNEIQGQIEYNSSLFKTNTAQRLSKHLITLLEQACAHPYQPLQQLSLISSREIKQALNEWNATDTPRSDQLCVHQMFEQQVVKSPNSTALIHEGISLTYKQLNQQADHLAHRFIIAGITPNDRIALCLEPSVDMIIGMLATLKAGGTYIPLLPSLPDRRLSLMLEKSAPKLILTSESIQKRLDLPSSVTVLHHQQNVPTTVDQNKLPLSSPVSPDHLAYLLFTSGSSGTPKAVAMPHRSLVNLLLWHQHHNRCAPTCRTLQFTSLSFDVSFQEIFSTWVTGGTLILPPEKIRPNFSAMLDFIIEQQINHLFLPMSALQALAVSAIETQRFPATLDNVFTAGESLRITPQLFDFFKTLPHCRLHNHYGPTEAHVIVSALTLPHAPEDWPEFPTIGRPLSNVKLYILDEQQNLCPPGVPGELHIGGNCLAEGYFDEPELTRRAFITDPFDPNSCSRLYRSGDLTRWNDDGEIEFIGRMDQQVKIRGFRIELEEIEFHLCCHPDILDAVVVVQESPDQLQKLVAWILTSQEIPLPATELRLFLKEQLPDYMVPVHFITLKTFPRTNSGKINRKNLTTREITSSDASLNPLPFSWETPTQEIIACCWANVLDIQAFGLDDNFFDLGGHSLLAARLIAQLRKATNTELPLSILFENPSIRQLSLAVDSATPQIHDLRPPSIKSVTKKTSLPLSWAMERIWEQSRNHPGNIVTRALRIKGALNLGALERSFSTILERHEALRTTFTEVDGEALQIVNPACAFSINQEQLTLSETDPPCDSQLSQIVTYFVKRWSKPFDLERDLMIRASLLKITDDDQILVYEIHHMVFDGESVLLFFHELSALYQSFTNNTPSKLSPVLFQISDYSLWQKSWLYRDSPIFLKQLAYWRKQLTPPAAPLKLPFTWESQATPDLKRSKQKFKISNSLTRKILALNQQTQSTIFTTMLAAFKATLFKVSGANDLLVGSYASGRHHPETENIIGFLTNLLAIRSQISSCMSFIEVIELVQKQTLQAQANQDIPFEELCSALSSENIFPPVISCIFKCIHEHSPPKMEKLRVTHYTIEKTHNMPWGFTFTIRFQNGELHGSSSFDSNLFDPDKVSVFTSQYLRFLENCICTPDLAISKVEI